ncbi:helix-turn-helix transcriptional regulator [Pantoea agglomerans]|uniref:helix-turn-helix domain-containing protein n=1 Tax=Enterobacter agglomerans TaxID=549 RepID=UPI003C79B678
MTNSIAKRLIERRADMQISQSELAKISGVAAAQISRYESGKAKPTPQVLSKLAKALLCHYEWLSDGIGDEYIKSQEEGGITFAFNVDGHMAEAMEAAAKSISITKDEFAKALFIFNMHMLKIEKD